MRRLIRITEKVLRLWWALLVAALLLASCKTVYVPVETVSKDSIYINKWMRDSIYIKDSVFVHTKADTVFLTKYHTLYKEVVICDTTIVSRIDTTTIVKEVPKNFTQIETLKMNIGNGVLWAIPIILFLYILYRKLKK